MTSPSDLRRLRHLLVAVTVKHHDAYTENVFYDFITVINLLLI